MPNWITITKRNRSVDNFVEKCVREVQKKIIKKIIAKFNIKTVSKIIDPKKYKKNFRSINK